MAEDRNRDDVAAMRAKIDQARAASTEVAAMIADYFKALIVAGLQRDEALALTQTYEAMLLGMALAQRDDA